MAALARRAVAILIALAQAGAAGAALEPGAQPGDCRSALRVGLVICKRPDFAAPGDAPVSRAASEAQVNAFLDQYGKPPREAVRALLDPTDENIAAWIHQQRQVVAVASYVASRMSQMQAGLDAGQAPPMQGPGAAGPEQAAMMQMRVTLFVKAADQSGSEAAQALERLIARFPALDGRLVQVASHARAGATPGPGGAGAVLPVSVVAADAIDTARLPFLVLEDLRHGERRLLDANGVNEQAIARAIVLLRSEAQPQARSPGPAGPMP